MEKGMEGGMEDSMEKVSRRLTRRPRRIAALTVGVATVLLVTTGATAQDAPVGAMQPGAPGKPTREASAAASVLHGVVGTEADVRFVRGMIPHHAQALEMTALAESRAERPEVLALAARIERGQREEIEMMDAWLARHGSGEDADRHRNGHRHEAVPPPGEAADPVEEGPAPRHGMLTPEEMETLAATRGHGFDRLFLRYMIRHHEGALAMVADLFAAGGGGTAEMFQLASHIDGDQRIEIARMRRMLSVE